MPSANLEKLNRALGQIDRPGTFAVSGSVPAVLPGLEVEGLGPVGLPLNAGTAKDLAKHCHQAPYGKGEETIVDATVRRVWRMEPDHFAPKDPDWDRVIKEIIAKVQDLHSQIDEHKIDLTHVTDRRGSPQTLVCTKTTASYQASVKKSHEDQEHLKTIEAIRASLPK